MQKISPFLWFDHQAEEATNFYVSLFKNSSVGMVSRYGDAGPGPKGTVMTTAFRLNGRDISALNGGPLFKFTPACSFFVNCESQAEIDALWQELSPGGSVFMPMQEYPFSKRFGWVQDRFGLSWQLNQGGGTLEINPFLLFVGKQKGRAEEAMQFYTSLFKNSGIQRLERYGKVEGETEGTVLHGVFTLNGEKFMAMDSSRKHDFGFNEAFSFFVNCETQEEIDFLWSTFTRDGAESQCGWVKDKFGVSWQIVPTALGKLLHGADPARSKNAMAAMLKMKKLNIAELQRAYDAPIGR